MLSRLITRFRQLWEIGYQVVRKPLLLPTERPSTVPLSTCPHLRLENDHQQVLQSANDRRRCFFWGYPERVGRHYMSAVCTTGRYRECLRLSSPSFNEPQSALAPAFPAEAKDTRQKLPRLNPTLRELLHHPEAVLGIAVILVFIGLSIYTVIAIPYGVAIQLWSPQSGDKQELPKNAQPIWVNLFRQDPLPPTLVQNSASQASPAIKTVQASDSSVDETITYTIQYPYGGYPQDLLIVFDGQYVKKPFVTLTWLTPDGREFDLGSFSVVSKQRYIASQDLPKKYLTGQAFQSQDTLLTGVGGFPAVQILFKNPALAETAPPLKGTYTLRLDAVMFEPGSRLDAEVVLYGQVYGLAGTDDLRRDLSVALLWGMPVALAFGFVGALATSILSMIIAALGSWFGGWIDGLIQRLTELNMILPVLPMAITIYYLYSKSVWVILGVIVLLSIFGSSIKNYRAAFLQVKELPYIEAAKAYGASNWRLISQYMVPRIIPLLIPQLVILIPSYVFFEATLAYLNVSDPTLPTWGKVIYDALTRGAFQGHYFWVLEPVALMVISGLAFAVVGFALDSILNPRLRKI